AKETKEESLFIVMGENEIKTKEAYETAAHTPLVLNQFFNQTVSSKLAQTILPYLVSGGKRKTRHYKDFHFSRTDLWSAGISGDYPTMVYEINKEDDFVRLKIYLEVWAFLSQQKVNSDFIVLFSEQGDYQQKKYNDIINIIHQNNLVSRIGRNGGIHLVNTLRYPSQVRKTILTTASFIITRTLPTIQALREFKPILLHTAQAIEPPLKATATTHNGYFSNGKFVITNAPNVPWTHILANKNFGTQVTEKSLGFTFACNSRENRLTPWSNDATNHYTGEWLIGKIGNRYYDLISGTTAVYSSEQVVYYGTIDDNAYQVTVTISGNQKQIILTRENSKEPWLVAYYTTPTIGFNRKFANQLITSIHQEIPMVYQPFQTTYSGYMGLHCNIPYHICFQPLDFWQGHWQAPPHQPDGMVCCSVIAQVKNNATFTLAFGETPDQLIEEIHHRPQKDAIRNTIIIQTGEKALDEMVNTFLPHQVLAARLYAKTGFYQCSGAYGFRDQLQDASNLNQLMPEQAKQQILLHCSRQFEEGDVLHWWHELPSGPAGVRTQCSDDMLWLPLAIARYVHITNDSDILNQEIATLKGSPLSDNQQERYDSTFSQGDVCNVYEHGKRAIGRVTFSPRGLAHIGSCDWNDGFSAVGTKGKGESVWLTQFFSMVCETYADIATKMADNIFAKWLIEQANRCKKAVEMHCWDTNHYTRAYFDCGKPIGSSDCCENQVDVLPQAFAVLCNLPNQARNQLALQTAVQTNVNHQHRLIHLFTPPFEETYAGYISAYPKGIRENGGQYTHGVIWLIQALIQSGEIETAYRLIQYVNPATHCANEQQANEYQGEPYAIAGDITTHPDAMGRCGWTQYTGAAGWLYRVITEDLFGVHLQGDHIHLSPRLPKALYESKCTVTINNQTIEINFQLKNPCYSDFIIPLKDGKHCYTVTDEGLIDRFLSCNKDTDLI
ncbi:MAG: hypothetical protein IKU10_05355, partial [Clostridia bacterium]|nr:hypothetical protein [Clostridia bacterium]